MSPRAPVTAVRLGGRPDQPLLLLGPALGSTAQQVWGAAADHLAEHFQVVGWDLPGHGHNRTPVEEPFTLAGLAAGVLEMVDLMGGGLQPPTFHYAGVGAGAAVGLQLLLDAPGRVESAVLLGAGATADSLVAGAVQGDHDAEGHAAVVDALAGFDVRRRLGRIAAPVLVVAAPGNDAAGLEPLREVAQEVADGRLVEHDAAAGPPGLLADPAGLARLLREHALGPPDTTLDDLARELGALVGTREGATRGDHLDQRALAVVSLAALVASGHHETLAEEVRAARAHGVGPQEIADLVLRVAQLCGVPVAESALGVVGPVLREDRPG
jgi:3-oxoadipate enol-lactonase/4-carboxymuconolactone decarboxylase